jgi:nitroreductase
VERRILDAGRVAGSAKNRQPWTFLVVRDDAAVEAVAESVFEPLNIRGAAFLVAILMNGGAGIDAGRAAQNMMIVAWGDGVASVPNGIADRERLVRLLALEEDERAVVILSFGYPERPLDVARRTATEWSARARRLPLSELVRRPPGHP